MATNAGYAPVHVPRPSRGGPKPVLDDPEIRRTMLNMAAAGASRKAIARRIGINPSRLRDWLARGDAQPDVEPWGSFAREFLDAERMLDSTITGGQAQQVHYILSKSAKERTPWECDYLGRVLVARFPAEHGSAAMGNGQMRVIEQDISPEEWWQKQGLVGDQLRALLRDPPEAVAAAQLAEGDAIVARLLADGWEPSAALCSAVDARRMAIAGKDVTK